MWDAFKDFIFWCIQSCHSFVGDWGLAIIIITVIFRLLISPLMIKQTKSSYQMQKVSPLIKEIQEKYKDDQPRMQEELQKVYAEAKFNPIAGCLPLLLQMPIFMALFDVLRNLPNYIGEGNGVYCFYSLVPDLTLSPSTALEQGFLAFLPYIILLLIFALATFIPTLLQQNMTADSSQRKQTFMMMGFMSLFMLWIGWGSPAGVLLFWGASSLIGIGQQQFALARMRKEDAEKESEVIDVKPVEVDVTRRTKKKRPTKSR